MLYILIILILITKYHRVSLVQGCNASLIAEYLEKIGKPF